MLAIGIWSLRGTGWMFLGGMLAVFTGITLNVMAMTRQNDAIFIISVLAIMVFLALASYNALRQVAIGNEINPNRIIGAICIYLMLGIMWGGAYAMVEYLRPDSFSGSADVLSPGLGPDWVYYSFVTITTLGYGDITPLTPTARALSVAEAITGQFYIAVLVAGLVSAYISSKSSMND